MRLLTVDDCRRVRLPRTKPGQVFAYQSTSNGTIKLVPMTTKAEPKRVVAKMSKRAGKLFFQVPKGYRLNPDAIADAVAEERASRS